MTISLQWARYWKIGRMVGINLFFRAPYNGNQGLDNNYTTVYISNLPYTSIDTGNDNQRANMSSSGWGTGWANFCMVKRNSTQMYFGNSFSYKGIGESPPIFNDNGNESSNYSRMHWRELETSTNRGYALTECVYVSAS